MRPPSLALIRLLLRALPAGLRALDQSTLEAACLDSLARERGRLGRLGLPCAWARLIADILGNAVLLRLDDRRRRRAWRHTAHFAPKEMLMSRVWQDVRYAARRLRRAPMFALSIVAILALTIGATTAVFTIVNGVLLRSLPYRDPGRLVFLHETLPKMPFFGFSPPDYLALEARATMFDSIAAYRNREYELSGVEPPERVIVTRASAALFDTLGVRPAVGQPFTREDDQARRPVAVISDGLWERKFGRDPAAIGGKLLLDRQPFTILGVMPRGFAFPHRGPLANNVPADVWVPIAFSPGQRQAFGSNYNLSVIARLKPGRTTAQADSEMRALVPSDAREIYPADLSGLASALLGSAASMGEEITGGSRTVLWIALAAVGIVLLVACTNIASLLLARAIGRAREIAVCTALGAGRGRIARQILAESTLLALAGSILGLLVGIWLARVLATFAPAMVPRLDDVRLDLRVLLFSFAVAMITALVCGVLPALELSRPRGGALAAGSRTTAGLRERRIFGALVAAQIAMAVILLVGGGLLLRSFSKLMAVDPGFSAERVLTFGTSLPFQGYRTAGAVRTFYARVLDDVAGVPGVRSAGASTQLPLSVDERRAFAIEQERAATAALAHSAAHQWTAGAYLDAVGIPLKRGRSFSSGDGADSEPVAMVNETMARIFWGGADPVGMRIAFGSATQHGPWMRIVGVVGDVKQGPLNTETVPHMYTPMAQAPDPMVADNVAAVLRSLRIALRSDVPPTTLIGAVRERLRAIDPALPLTSVQTMSEIVKRSSEIPRFNAWLVSLFAMLALLLAGIGVGGMLTMSVSSRLRELGVRLALGAPRRTVAGMVVGQGMLLAAAGLAIGLTGAWWLSRVLSSLLFEVTPRDPTTFATVAAVLSAVALAACALPAWRATRIDPLKVLRIE